MTVAAPPLLETGADGHLRVAGTGVKVRLLAGWRRYQGMTADDLLENFPQLTADQVAAALDHYRANRAAIDADLDRRAAEVERTRAEAGYSPLLRRLWEEGRLPAHIPPPPNVDPVLHGSQRTQGDR